MEDIKGPQVKDFVATAEVFCRTLEQASNKRTGELLNGLQLLLPQLYMKCTLLPKPKYCYEEEPMTFVREDDYARVHNALQHKFELFNGITGMSPGTLPTQHELISFGMAESFTDLYEELKNFVKLYEVGLPQSMNDALWNCRKGFEHQMGIRLIDCMKSLHTFMYDKTSTGSRAIQRNDFSQDADEEESWYSDDQEEVYGDDE